VSNSIDDVESRASVSDNQSVRRTHHPKTESREASEVEGWGKIRDI
jgi:hypothetical protein